MMRMIHLGDLEVALPLAAALGAWLVAAGAWRTALRWGLCFGAAVVLVGGSKIAFLGWGTGLAALEFKALSGHATVVTALYPMLAWVLLYRQGPAASRVGLATGLGLGAVVAALLVVEGEHTGAEALGGWLLGAAVSLAGIALSRELRTARLLPGLWRSLPVFVVGAWLMESAHVGYWMVRVALALSGNSRPHAWDTCS
ncbi:hypothetical protein [Massilia sp.]|uniref:hypothetical protein n=1 Tax=Massilia sp. TaxID=1882437 RepID=UPI00289C6EB8|nr:hypothetical protein [Massilia sp.]